MLPECKKCKGAGIAGLGLAFILHCPVDIDKHECPYLPPQKHSHQEVYIPLEYSNSMITVATTAASSDHPYIVYEREDPARPGNTIYYIDLSSEST